MASTESPLVVRGGQNHIVLLVEINASPTDGTLTGLQVIIIVFVFVFLFCFVFFFLDLVDSTCVFSSLSNFFLNFYLFIFFIFIILQL